ncbi:MAG TPA: hypothetical protein VMN56_13615 [Casimicrobiaceae bacterium]|nr:hypothetical protein [Casimicrobiaceae bacterium]
MSREQARARATAWWPFLAVIAAYAAVALQQITLPGVYMDAVNPDYMAVSVLNRHGEPITAWLLPGNYLAQRYPVLISFYHGSQQFWLGLPFFWLFGTTVTGLRLTHALFALGVLAAMYAFLGRVGMKPWLAALACAALAVDPSFSYAFRTQSYITLAPAAWLFLALYSIVRAGETDARATRWLWAGGLFYGFAVTGYFIYAFFLPALALAVRWMPPQARSARACVALVAGALLGGICYPVGYALAINQLGGVAAAWDYFQQTQRAINAFSEQPDWTTRVAHVANMVDAVFKNWFHHTLIFGEHGEVPGGEFKMALLLGAPLLLWARAEWRRQRPIALRTLVALGMSYAAVALAFGTRLSGHHFVVLLPIAYSALALGGVALAAGGPAWRAGAWTVAAPFAALIGLNVGGQIQEAQRLHETRGVGLYSDAISRLAADLDARTRKPFVYFPDWGLSMPVAFLTGGRVGMDSIENYAAARRMLCTGRDVAVAVVTGDRAARIAAWQAALRWEPPAVADYRQGDGTVAFALATFRGDPGGSDCAATLAPAAK